MIGTSDQSCWLAEACKILLLVPLREIKLEVWFCQRLNFWDPSTDTLAASGPCPEAWTGG